MGERVRGLRVQKGWTQPELAEASGIDQSTISKIENGETRSPHPVTLRAIADALDTVPEVLLGVIDAKDAPRSSTDLSLPERRLVAARRMAERSDPRMLGWIDGLPAIAFGTAGDPNQAELSPDRNRPAHMVSSVQEDRMAEFERTRPFSDVESYALEGVGAVVWVGARPGNAIHAVGPVVTLDTTRFALGLLRPAKA